MCIGTHVALPTLISGFLLGWLTTSRYHLHEIGQYRVESTGLMLMAYGQLLGENIIIAKTGPTLKSPALPPLTSRICDSASGST